MPIGATIAAVGSLGSGLLGYFGAQKAAKQQAAGQKAILDLYRPYAQMGQGAMTTLSQLFGIGGGQPFGEGALSAWRNTPGYQFARTEGLRGIDFGDSARGQLLSSNNLDNRMGYAANLADKTFMGSYVSPLLQLAGIGSGGIQGAAGALGGIANAQAGGTVGGFNALGQGLGNFGNNLMLYNMYKSAYGPPAGAGGGMGGGGGFNFLG